VSTVINWRHAGGDGSTSESDQTMEIKSHKINLTQKRKSPNGQWVFYPVQWNANKPDPRLVIINGEPTSWEGGGSFFLDWREGKRKRKLAGRAPREALDAWRNATGVANGSISDDANESDDANNSTNEATNMPGITIEKGIKQYLTAVKATKGPGTHSSYETCLDWAKRHITRHLVYRLDRNDLLALFAAGRKEGLNQKTINKRVTVVLSMVRHNDHDIKLKKGDWPKTTDKAIQIYTEKEIEDFFAACSEDELLLFEVFLCTGFRDAEVAHLMWSDIDYRLSRISVTAKAEYKFNPKSYEMRSVDVPQSLLNSLKRRQERSESLLVFPSAAHPTRKAYGGGVDEHMLETCKEIAFRAGLNCGHCKGTFTVKKSKKRKEIVPYSCKTHPRCERWFLHKWRHTFASHMIGVLGLKGLQLAMGHKDIATTSKYLHYLGSASIKEKVEASELAKLVR
jgi:integrase/recombinase XerD